LSDPTPLLLSRRDLIKRAQKIRLFAMDVDGVLTDGSILILNSGEEVKVWHVRDRIGFFILKKFKDRFSLAWITGRKSRQVEVRAKELGVASLHQNCEDKGAALEETVRKFRVTLDQTLFLGDDLVDLPALKRAGLAICPSDAHPDIQRVCHWVTPSAGGRGAFREVVDFVLQAQGLHQTVLNHFERPAG